MVRNAFRNLGASALIFAIVFGGLVIPSNVFGQTTAKDTEKKDKKDKAKVQPSPTPSATSKTLTPEEDPALIGKRNINKGSDRLFGWFGGSREKEAAIGRQISAEVESQVKFSFAFRCKSAVYH
jgi:hypothetical protein